MASTSQPSSSRAKHIIDAGIMGAFDASPSSFDYSEIIKFPPHLISDLQSDEYFEKMQRGGELQPFGCLLCFEESSFRVVAYSENAHEMLGLLPEQSAGAVLTLGFGTDVRSLFTDAGVQALQLSLDVREMRFYNPLLLSCRSSDKLFYGILHRVDVGVIIDLEPTDVSEPELLVSRALQLRKLAASASTELRALPPGDIPLLCDSIAMHVRKLTEYDRVMVYKFHADEHGEVVAEHKRDDLEPFLGLHYPGRDIPHSSRYLFEMNKVRMIVDCCKEPVRVVQDQTLMQPLSLFGSTLRAPHKCHVTYMKNMLSIASLVLAVTVNADKDDNSKRLWGMVVCHHTSPRSVDFPLREACVSLVQAFALQLNAEILVASQNKENQIMKIQTILCNFLRSGSPTSIVAQNPNIMDLCKCNGAALYYDGKYWPLGVAPTESQIVEIMGWLLTSNAGSTSFRTSSLVDTGYPGAAALGDAVCGVVVAFVTPKDVMFWFRSQKSLEWASQINYPEDGGKQMHPRSSFKAFKEMEEKKALAWENVELDAIHSLQLVFRELQQALDTQGDESYARMKELTYICHEMKSPLSGVYFSNSLMDTTKLSESQKQFLEASASCERQMLNIINDTNLQAIDDGSLALEKTDFSLEKVIDAVVSQAMILLQERGLRLIREIPDGLKEISVFADQLRIQQVLAGFLLCMVRHAASPDSNVEFHIGAGRKQNPDLTEVVTLHFRIMCHGKGLPTELVQDIFHDSHWSSEEGLSLCMCRKILNLMDGKLQYSPEVDRCSLDIDIKLDVSRG